MAIERVICEACRGNLEWRPDLRVFVCPSCGSVYRRVDEAEIHKSETELKIEKLHHEQVLREKEIEEQRLAKEREESRSTIAIIGCIVSIFAFLVLMFFIASHK